MSDWIDPEERIAQRWFKRLELQPPFVIDDIVQIFADVEEDILPVKADAILVSNPRTRARPLVILDEGLPKTRRTFTLAHELGHLLIPWHSGTFVCTPTATLEDPAVGEYIYQGLEREANRFAAEFLLPREYVQRLFAEEKSPAAMLRVTSAADISVLAASFKFLKVLPGGFLMMELSQDGRIKCAGKTSATFLDPPERGAKSDLSQFTDIGGVVEKVNGAVSTIVWVDIRSAKINAPAVVGMPNSTEIIQEIIRDLGCSDCSPRINGIIGAGNSIMRRSGKGDLYTVLTKRFEGREDLQEIIAHPKFPVFLAKKAEEIAQKAS